MTENSRVAFFHVGLPKTASTFLQRRVFPFFRDIQYIKKHDFKRQEKYLRANSELPVLLSIEFFPNAGDKYTIEKIEQVKTNFDKVYPIIVFRKHSSWLRSRYKYHIRKHGSSEFNQFIDPDTAKGREVRNSLQFYPNITTLEKSYGTRPLVLFQEELKNAPHETVNLIADYTGAVLDTGKIKPSTVKKSYSEHQLKWVRRFNKIYPYRPQKIHSPVIKKIYKKVSQFFLHTVAFFANVLPDPEGGKNLIPPKEITIIDEEYREDWEKCKAYAKKTRELLFEE